MTSITPPRDDEGSVQLRLRRATDAPVDKPRRSAPKPAPRAVPEQDDDAAQNRDSARQSQQPRGTERRTQERRRRREAVLLDTRAPIGNRRRGARRDEDRRIPRLSAANTGGDPPAGTILDDDIYA